MNFIIEPNRIFYKEENGRLLAEITFPTVDVMTVDINHTFVDDSMSGQGIAGRLMEAALAEISRQGKKVRTSCSYAAHWMTKHPEFSHLKAE